MDDTIVSRIPTSRDQAYAWHANATRGLLAEDMPIDGNDPQCGWFKRRLVKGGPWVPARIWLFQLCDEETGELIADETMQCEVDGKFADAEDAWTWLCANPISKAEFDFLTARRQWSEDYAPEEPMANPYQAVDWTAVPTPIF